MVDTEPSEEYREAQQRFAKHLDILRVMLLRRLLLLSALLLHNEEELVTLNHGRCAPPHCRCEQAQHEAQR